MTVYADVCILTDLRFPGGNASSTLEELDFFHAAGLRVFAIHCPANASGSKPTSSRYERHHERCLPAAGVERIVTQTLLIRAPAVVCGDGFRSLTDRIEARNIAVIVNNSMFRAGGEPAYDPSEFLRRVRALRSPSRLIFPIGPLIRQELRRYVPMPSPDWLGPFDWNPTFDIEGIGSQPRQQLSRPFAIGRHGRDAAEKWLEDPALLRRAYPAGPEFEVRILGGADAARKLLGRIPANWQVLPFGALPPQDFLAGLDAFVYFPHMGLREAFGRTVVEAACAGVPCVLPDQLRPAFADFAFFCEPSAVADVVRRLALRDSLRIRFLEHARSQVTRLYSSQSLFLRLEYLEALAEDRRFRPVSVVRELSPELREYQRWVETGFGQ